LVKFPKFISKISCFTFTILLPDVHLLFKRVRLPITKFQITLNMFHKSQSRKSIPVTMSYNFNVSCLKSSLIAVFLLLLQPVFSQYNWSGLDTELQAKQKLLGTDLVVMLWKKGDTLIYKKELGTFNSKTSAPIASCSKWLTAALLMVFVDEGKLSLDDKISQWIP